MPTAWPGAAVLGWGLLLAALLALSPWSAWAAGDGRVVRIVSPAPDAVVHDNRGSMSVVVSVAPPLEPESGATAVVLLDGRAVASGAGTSLDLGGVDRGTHRLQVQVIARDGTVLGTSSPVVFHMWRASRLFRQRTP